MHRWLIRLSIMVLMVGLNVGCNLEDEAQISGPECSADADCDDGVCSHNECVECEADNHCSGDDICSNLECVSGCTDLDCGAVGACVDDDSEISCECDEGAYLEDGICRECDCTLENGVAACTDDGTCIIDSCDDEYFTEDDDFETGCECGPDDWPDADNFTDQNCDGLDGDASFAVFVSPFGDDDNDGIRTRPVRTINRGIEIALDSSQDRRELYIAAGEYDEIIELTEAISLYGGYFDAGLGEWERSHDNETIITGIGVTGGHRPVEIVGVEDDMELQLLTIRAADAPTTSLGESSQPTGDPASSIGVVLYGNTGHIDISHATIEAGAGNSGRNGEPGGEGVDGAIGGQGYDVFHADYPSEAGAASSQSCAYGDTNIGGDGGAGRLPEDPHSGEDGHDASVGGGGGSGGTSNVAPECGPSPVYSLPERGDDAPSPGADGADGISASPDSLLMASSIVPGGRLYLGAQAEPSEHGSAGGGGGGGGGSGGYLFELCYNGCSCVEFNGSGGGAGGNGGCAGERGSGGGWAGGSFGVLVHSTSAQLHSTVIRTANGGDGGDGAPGGSGGDGGPGGPKGTTGTDSADELGYAAADGGDGSAGGRGGDGAGGLGGPSIGVLHQNADIVTEAVTFELGDGGPGGQGGGEDNDGSAGLEAEIHQIIE